MGNLWCPISHNPYATTASKAFTVNFVATITTTITTTFSGGCGNINETTSEIKEYKTNVGSVKLVAKGIRPMMDPNGNPLPRSGPWGPNDWEINNMQELNDKAKEGYDKAQQEMNKLLTEEEYVKSTPKICWVPSANPGCPPQKQEKTLTKTVKKIKTGSIEGKIVGGCNGSYDPI